jgi:hypothetical protein
MKILLVGFGKRTTFDANVHRHAGVETPAWKHSFIVDLIFCCFSSFTDAALLLNFVLHLALQAD